MIIDDSRMREPVFDIHILNYINDDRRVYYYIPNPKTNPEKLKDTHTWFWEYSDDTMKLNNNIAIFNL